MRSSRRRARRSTDGAAIWRSLRPSSRHRRELRRSLGAQTDMPRPHQDHGWSAPRGRREVARVDAPQFSPLGDFGEGERPPRNHRARGVGDVATQHAIVVTARGPVTRCRLPAVRTNGRDPERGCVDSAWVASHRRSSPGSTRDRARGRRRRSRTRTASSHRTIRTTRWSRRGYAAARVVCAPAFWQNARVASSSTAAISLLSGVRSVGCCSNSENCTGSMWSGVAWIEPSRVSVRQLRFVRVMAIFESNGHAGAWSRRSRPNARDVSGRAASNVTPVGSTDDTSAFMSMVRHVLFQSNVKTSGYGLHASC